MNIPKQLLGIGWKIFSCLNFAFANILVRYLSGGSPNDIEQPLSIYTIMFWQNFFGALLIYLLNNKRKRNQEYKIKDQLVYWHLLRILIAAIGVGLWYMSLRYFIVPQAIALGFISPIIILLAAVFILDEKIYFTKGLAIISSLLGGFIITRPDLQLFDMSFSFYVFLPIGAQLLFHWDRIVTRQLLKKGAVAKNLTFYLLVGMSFFSTLPMLYYGWQQPSIKNLCWLLLLAIFGISAHFSFAKAYYYAEITYLLPFGISRLLFSSVASFLVFHETPQFNHIWIGIVIITFSVLLLEPMHDAKGKHKDRILV